MKKNSLQKPHDKLGYQFFVGVNHLSFIHVLPKISIEETVLSTKKVFPRTRNPTKLVFLLIFASWTWVLSQTLNLANSFPHEKFGSK